MAIVDVFLEVVAVLSLLLSVSLVAVVGPEELRTAADELPARLRTGVRPIGLLVAVLLVNRVVRNTGVELSWVIGYNITRLLYTIEGTVVAAIQSAVPGWLVLYFGYVYVYGYVFLLVFPLLAGMLTGRRRYLRETAVAYTINYAVGMCCYLLFVSYGPRNYEIVESLLFDTLPRFQLLISEVNANTNVFPSLHTSLSTTAALLSIRDHETFPRWTPVAVFLAASIVLSTMVLGIHWATDVVAGWALAGLSVWAVSSDRAAAFADRLVPVDRARSLLARLR